MSVRPGETKNDMNRKRSYGLTLPHGMIDYPNRPAQEPRLADEGRNQLLMGQFLNNITANQVQGAALLGKVISLAQPSGPNGSSIPSACAPPMAPIQFSQQAGAPIINNNTMMNYQQVQSVPSDTSAQQKVADLVRQALALQQQVPQGSVPIPFTLPSPAQAPIQASPLPAAAFSVNPMVAPQYQAATPYTTQSQPLTQAQKQDVPYAQPGQFRPFGMEPQELLNYAVMVNILHNNTSRGNVNALPNPLLNRPQVPQDPINHAIQTAPQGAMHGVQGFTGHPYPLPPVNQMMQQTAFASNQTSDTDGSRFTSLTHEHTVSPSIPSESNFDTEAIALPNHVIEAQKIDPQVRCVLLCTNQDKARLSTQQCWLRKQIETFPASERDVRRHTRGRNRILKLGQVGIQCIHCKNLPQEGRGKGSSYFLSSTKGIYQAAQNILAYHFKEDSCPIISQKLLQEMRDAGSSGCPRHLAPKAGKSRSGGGKSFWEYSALHITCLVDTTVGIRYSDDRQNYRPLESVTLGLTETIDTRFCSSESVLVTCKDKESVTDFCYLLMCQFIPFSDDTRKSSYEYNRDSDLEDDDEAHRYGIVCRFCRGISYEGKHRDGVFLSIKPSTMMRNKQLIKLHNHITSCRYVPDDLKRTVIDAHEMHLPQSDQLKRGWKKKFFENVSLRLKSALDTVGDSSDGKTSH